jgi:hypothetical protein
MLFYQSKLNTEHLGPGTLLGGAGRWGTKAPYLLAAVQVSEWGVDHKGRGYVWTFDPTLSKQGAVKVSSVSGLDYTAVGLSDKDGEMDVKGIVRPVRSLAT